MSYEPYRQNKIETGLLFQDFVVDCCWNLIGLAVVQYSSRFYQQQVGESKTGVEIKHDEIYARTGNLWIETAEKAQPRPGPYADSGIFRGDNSWLYVIGDYDTIFIFAKRLLQALAKSGKYPILENGSFTSKGFLLRSSAQEPERYAAQILYPNAAKKIGKDITDLMQLGRELHQAVLNKDNGQLDLFKSQTT